MELHEYQVKSLLSRFGVPSPLHFLLEVGCDIEAAVSKFGFEPLLVKSQVHGRGRKEGGGERSVGRPKELSEALKEMLGATVVTSASGLQGFTVSKVMVMSVPSVVKKFQLMIFLTSGGDVEVSLCQEGGKVFTEHPFEGCIRPFQVNRLTSSLGIRGAQATVFKRVLEGVLSAFFHFDALLIEIGSLVLTEGGLFQVLDARMVVDDYALYRQPEVLHMMDPLQVRPRISVSPYMCLHMGGEIGCLSNGLGMALATADLIRRFDGSLGSVVDIGSEVTEERLVKGLGMLQKEKQKVVCVNLFTGLIDGEMIARAIKREISQIPMVVRLEGTNAAGGRLLLKGLEPMCIVTESLDEAARTAVGCVTAPNVEIES